MSPTSCAYYAEAATSAGGVSPCGGSTRTAGIRCCETFLILSRQASRLKTRSRPQPRNEHIRPLTYDDAHATPAGTFPNGSQGLATATTFGVDCGCDGGTPTPATITPEPSSSGPGAAPTSTSSSSEGGCAAGAGVFVTSSEFLLLEGCLQETDRYANIGVEFVSDTGLIIAIAPINAPETARTACFVCFVFFCSSCSTPSCTLCCSVFVGAPTCLFHLPNIWAYLRGFCSTTQRLGCCFYLTHFRRSFRKVLLRVRRISDVRPNHKNRHTPTLSPTLLCTFRSRQQRNGLTLLTVVVSFGVCFDLLVCPSASFFYLRCSSASPAWVCLPVSRRRWLTNIEFISQSVSSAIGSHIRVTTAATATAAVAAADMPLCE